MLLVRNELLISLFGWVAENEKRVLQERVKAGIERYRKDGKPWGRRTKEPDKSKVMKYRGQGLSWAEVARVMNIPPSTLYKYKDIWEEQDRIKRIEQV